MPLLHSRNKARFLLGVQLAFIVSSLTWAAMASFWLSFVFPVFFGLSGAILASDKRWFFSYLGLSALTLFFGAFEHPVTGFLHLLCLGGTFFLLFREIVRHSFFKPEVPQSDRIVAGITGYLAIGLFWFLFLHVATKIDPEALINQLTQTAPNLNDQLYFSFVTLTTLGYGDIVPVSQLAKVVVMLTTLSGVLYLAVFISALIGGSTSKK